MGSGGAATALGHSHLPVWLGRNHLPTQSLNFLICKLE